MADILVQDDYLTVSITGMDRVLALRNELCIPLSHVRGVSIRPSEARAWWHWLRMPGTHVPGVVTAGTFFTDDGKVFYDMRNPAKTVAIDLDHESFKRVIVEVDDPEDVVERIRSELRSGEPVAVMT